MSSTSKGGALSVVDMLSNVPILQEQEPVTAASAGVAVGTPEEEEELVGVRSGRDEEFTRGMDDPVGRGLLLQEDVEPLFTT